MQLASITIPGRYNGPPDSGNGGYSCGRLAACIDGPARVRLFTPPPLDRELTIKQEEPGRVELYDGEILVGRAVSCPLELDTPAAPSLEEAQAATTRFPCYHEHIFDTCFVCGPGRPAHDGLELFPGPVKDWGLLACPWVPAADLADAEGQVRTEIIWSALDCPGYFAAAGERRLHAVLGELDGEILRTARVAEPLVVFSWPLGEEGRKLYSGTAIATADGTLLAKARSTWITLKAS